MEQSSPNISQLLTEKQAACILAVSVAALRRWRRERRGPQFLRVEGCIRYSLVALERFLTEHSVGNRKAADSPSAAQSEVRDGHAALQTR
jgi:hypothetical protein